MKKLLALLLAGLMLLALCACGAKAEDAGEEAPAPKEETVAASDTAPVAVVEEDSSTGKSVEPTVEIPEAQALDAQQFELAKTYIGKSVDELIAAIGEPDSSEFSTSCLADGAEDGVLYYGAYGFYVYALREADGTETVQNIVEL